MIKLFVYICLTIAVLGGCSKKSTESIVTPVSAGPIIRQITFDSLQTFQNKAPQELFDDKTIGDVIKSVVPVESRKCLLDIFNYMPDMELKSDGSLYSSLNGSHADNWILSVFSVFKDGTFDLLVNCNTESKSNMYLYFTNRTDFKIPVHLIEWFTTYGADTDLVKIINATSNKTFTYADIIQGSARPITSTVSENIICNINGLKNNQINIDASKKSKSINNFTSDAICGSLQKVANEQVQNIVNARNTLCKGIDEYVVRYGGYSQAISDWQDKQPDSDSDKMLKILTNCGNPSLISELASNTVLSVYSIGSFTDFNQQICPGVLVEVRNDNSRIYYLKGYGKCQEFHSERNDTWNKVHTENVLHGDFLKKVLKYDGVLPNTYRLKHQDTPFYSY